MRGGGVVVGQPRLLAVAVAVAVAAAAAAAGTVPCGVAAATPRERAAALLVRMTLPERLSLLAGIKGPYVGNIAALPHLGIPQLNLEDGPQGVGDGTVNVTCWPDELAIAATWSRAAMAAFSRGVAVEQKLKGTNIALAPLSNLARLPRWGRNYESLGEDPWLQGELVTHAVRAVQDEGLVATCKHFAVYTQEYQRMTISANVGERPLRELYMHAFRKGIEAGCMAVMCSYNRVNNTAACADSHTINTILKGEMGFQGFVMSDWGATHSTVPSILGGLDMEMPGSTYFGKPLAEAVASGAVSESRIGNAALRVLTALYAVGIMDSKQPTGNLTVDATSYAHNQLARRLSEESTVLLKNEGSILPLTTTTPTIAIIGDDASRKVVNTGCGSGKVICPYTVSPLAGIKAAGAKVTYTPSSPVSAAVAAAKAADVAIVFVSTDSCEGSDRANLSLADHQNQLVAQVAAAQAKTIVVVNGPGAVLMPWLDAVRAVVFAWLPGQEDGNAIANVLFGRFNPSGRLPLSFPAAEDQTWLKTPIQYPGVNGQTEYIERLEIGYRWFDAAGEKPLFPFGYGLSYTTFKYSNLRVHESRFKEPGDKLLVSATITNTGSVDGWEVPQLYLSYPRHAGEPPKVLRGFDKIYVGAGKSSDVHFELRYDTDTIGIFDEDAEDGQGAWTIIRGDFGVLVGASSRDLPLMGKFRVE